MSAAVEVQTPVSVVDTGVAAALRGTGVLVTGGTGYIGRELVGSLIGVGARVVVLSRSPERARGLWDPAAVELRLGDLEIPRGAAGVCRGVELVFHLASYSGALAEDDRRGAEPHRRVTELGTQELLREAGASGVRHLVFLSSIRAMGEGRAGLQDETTPAHPTTAYGRSKLAAEQAVLAAAAQGGPPATVLRLPMVYGPGGRGNLPRLIEAIARGRFPPWPRRENHRSAVHLADVARAALTAACQPRAAGQVYLVCEPQAYSTRWLYEQILRALGRAPPRWAVPYGALYALAAAGTGLGWLLGCKLPLDRQVLARLAGDAWYSPERIRAELGFTTAHALGDELPVLVAEYLGSQPKPGG